MAELSDKQLADWLDQVADGLDSGMEASNALALARPLPGGRSERLVRAIQDGAGWSTVLSEPILALNRAEFAILSASERAGRMPEDMRKVAESRRETQALKRRLKLSLAYPLFLLHFAAFVFSITYLVNGDWMAFFVSTAMVLVPVWMSVGFFWVLYRCWPNALLAVTRRLPLLGAYRLHWDASVLCKVLASCLAAGMRVDESWETATAASGNPDHAKLGYRVLERVRNGSQASEGMDGKLSGFPPGFREVYCSGEKSGKLDRNLDTAANRYRTDASNKLTLASLLYPKVILVGIFGYVGYKIIKFVSDYFERLSEISM